MFSSVLGYHFGQQETELRWTQEREQLLAQQIETLHRKDKEIAQLEKSIGVLNDSALRVAHSRINAPGNPKLMHQ